MRILAVDSGTTTTRVSLMEANEVLGARSARLGARDAAGQPAGDRLLSEIRSLAEGLFEDVGGIWGSVDAVVAFGMITSELGLEEVPHVDGPAGAGELAAALRQRDFAPGIPPPMFLVPGVRVEFGDGLEFADFMRGEETEVVGLLATTDVRPPFLYVSAGSHTKFVAVDENGRIVWSFTTISGELLWALSQETILAGLLDPKRSGNNNSEMVAHGAHFAHEYGLSRALYVARLMNRLHDVTPLSCSAHIHGALAAADLDGLESLSERGGLALPERVRIKVGTSLAATYLQLLDERKWARDVAGVEGLGPAGAWHLLAMSGASAQGRSNGLSKGGARP